MARPIFESRVISSSPLRALCGAALLGLLSARANAGEATAQDQDHFKLGARLASVAERSCDQRGSDRQERMETLIKAAIELQTADAQMDSPDVAFAAGRVSDLLGRTNDAFHFFKEYLIRWEAQSVHAPKARLRSISACDPVFWARVDELAGQSMPRSEFRNVVNRIQDIRNGVSKSGKKSKADGCDPPMTAPIAIICATTTVPGELYVSRKESLDSQHPPNERAQGGAPVTPGAQEEVLVGKTPIDFAVYPGEFEIRVRARDYREAVGSTPQKLNQGQHYQIHLDLQRCEGYLTLNTTPEAHVYFTNAPIAPALTPIERKQLPVGAYEVLLRAKGYKDHPLSFVIGDNETATIPAKTDDVLALEIDPLQWATLHVAGTPKDARIKFAGHEQFINQGFPYFPEGTLPVVFTAGGYQSAQKTLSMFRGKTTAVTLQLTPDQKWYWPSLGYAVGGGLLLSGGIAALLAQHQQNEFFESPTKAELDKANATSTWGVGLLIAGGVVVAGTAGWDVWHLLRPGNPVRVNYE